MQIRFRAFELALSACILALAGADARAWSLRIDDPAHYLEATPRSRPRVDRFFDTRDPIHEEMTRRTLGCVDGAPCVGPLEALGIHAVDIMAGVRGNDFPAVYFDKARTDGCRNRWHRVHLPDSRPCYFGAVLNSNVLWKAPKAGPSSRESWFVRSHYGDLQAWHAMAPEREAASKTLENMLVWARFWYLVSMDRWPAGTDMTKLGIPEMRRFFMPGARHVEDFVDARGGPSRRGFALGAILHMLQDSFAPCHVDRNADGAIVQFFSYVGQSTSEHRKHDDSRAGAERVMALPYGPVAVGRELLALRARSAAWEQVEGVLRRAWRLAAATRMASAGKCEAPKPSDPNGA